MAGLITVLFVASGIAKSKGAPDGVANTGDVLLDSFGCNEHKNVVRRLADKLENLNGIYSKILADKKGCEGIARTFDTLPSITSIIRRFDSEENSLAIQSAIEQLEELQIDLEFVRKLPEREKGLWPSEDEIQSSIRQIKRSYPDLRAALSVQRAQDARQRFIEGFDQLDLWSQTLGEALEQSGCSEKNIEARVSSSLLGVSGFFFSTPAGLAVNLAGKVLQRTLSALKSSKFGSMREEVMGSLDNSNLVLGLTCAFEKTGEQYCRVLKAKRLADEDNGSSKGLGSLGALQSDTRFAVEGLSKWYNESMLSRTDIRRSQLYRKTRAVFETNFVTKISSSLDAVESEIGNAERLTPSQVDALFDSIAVPENILTPRMKGVPRLNRESDLYRGEIDSLVLDNLRKIIDEFGPSVRENSFFLMLGFSEQEAQTFARAFDARIEAHLKDDSMLKGQAKDKFTFGSIRQTFNGVSDFAEMQQIRAVLESPQTIKKIRAQLEQWRAKVIESTQDRLTTAERTKALTSLYEGGPFEERSPASQARVLGEFLDTLRASPPLQRMGLAYYRERLKYIIEAEDKWKAGTITPQEEEKIVEAFSEIFSENPGATSSDKGEAFLSFGKLVQSAMDAKLIAEKTQLSGAMGFITDDLFETVLGVSGTPTQKRDTMANAEETARSSLEGYSSLLDEYLDYGLGYLRGAPSYEQGGPNPRLLKNLCLATLLKEPPKEYPQCRTQTKEFGPAKIVYDELIKRKTNEGIEDFRLRRICSVSNAIAKERRDQRLERFKPAGAQ